MGMSANQARFLSLTSRQVDLEYRMQQICHRRLRLASELENIATKYNNALSDRKLFASNQTMYEKISVNNLDQLGYKVVDANNQIVSSSRFEPAKMVKSVAQQSTVPVGYTAITDAESFVNAINGDLNGNYILMDNIDMSELGTLSDSVITGTYTGTFEGNGYEISNLNIQGASAEHVGLFSQTDGATIQNLVLRDAYISSTGRKVGGIVANTTGAASTLDNLAVINIDIDCGTEQTYPFQTGFGGVLGFSDTNTTVSNSYSTGSVTGQRSVGGLVGDSSSIINSYSTATVTGNLYVGGLAGYIDDDIIDNCYATGNVTSVPNSDRDGQMVGGLVGISHATITDSYATGIVSGTGTQQGGFVGNQNDTIGNIDNSNFWNTDSTTIGEGLDPNNRCNAVGLTTTQIGTNTAPINTLDPAIWDISGETPQLIMNGISSGEEFTSLEDGLRNGTYSLVREADNYTQQPIGISGSNYELVDWRTVPNIDDDLYAANDTIAETEYESAIEKINSQDKKLQLEQSQVDVEHKAIVTQKDAVKSILNKNIESSFKTFS